MSPYSGGPWWRAGTISMRNLVINTAATNEPVSLVETKRHLRLAVTAMDAAEYNDEDSLLERLISAARYQAEQETGRAFITQTWDLYLDAWPTGNSIEIPLPPLVSATVTYRLEDDAGYDNTFTDVVVDTESEPGRVVLLDGYTWPSGDLYTANPIKVTFTCGYGDDTTDVPEGIRSAVLLMVSDLYENRGDVVIGTISSQLGAAGALLGQYRVWSFR